MITAEQIPPKVEEAFAKAFNSWERLSNAECLAIALAAWPGAFEFRSAHANYGQCLALPLPPEARDE